MENRILHYMYANGIHQKDLADKLGMCDKTLHRYITGEAEPKISIAMQIADEIGAKNIYDVFIFERK